MWHAVTPGFIVLCLGKTKQFVWVKDLLNKLRYGQALEGPPRPFILGFVPLFNPPPRSKTCDLLLTTGVCKGEGAPLSSLWHAVLDSDSLAHSGWRLVLLASFEEESCHGSYGHKK